MPSRDDAKLVSRIRQVTKGGSRVLVTLARLGKALERDQPDRAAFLLAAIGAHPLYKGGRLAFDMMEIEDLILEDAQVDLMSSDEVILILKSGTRHLAETLSRMSLGQNGSNLGKSHDSSNDLPIPTPRAPDASPDEVKEAMRMPRVSLGPNQHPSATRKAPERDELHKLREYPELRSSDYLYDYVVLGLFEVIGERMGAILL